MIPTQFHHEDTIQEILDNKIVSLELVNFFLGERLGSGCYRHVFEYKPDRRWVIKIDVGNRNANTLEWTNWDSFQEVPEIAKWLAPCGPMSVCGRILLQKRCKPLKYFPEKIPSFFTDVKFDNWGILRGLPVCFDYSRIIPTINTKLVASKDKRHDLI